MRPYYYDALNNKVSGWIHKAVGLKSQQVFKFFKKLYKKNKLNKCRRSKNTRIPKVFHHIWIGPKPFPEKYKEWQKTWQSIPGWKYKFWTDKEVENYPLINRELYESTTNIGAKADILRMEILCREGGVYIDTDFECLQPQMFDVLNSCYDFYSCITPLDAGGILVANGLIGSVPNHPIVKGYIENSKQTKSADGIVSVITRGPGFFTKMILAFADKGYKDIVLPPTFFYPLAIYPSKPKGGSLEQGSLAHLMTAPEGREEIKRLVNKPESLAIHWWEGSWIE